MRTLKFAIGIILISSLFSCDNEVEINAEFEEKTFVAGLLDTGRDTQFVKVTKTFLDNTIGAVELGQDPSNLYYDSLKITINELNDNNQVVNTFPLAKIFRPKESGIFTTEKNQAYFTTAPIKEDVVYSLEIDKLDGSDVVKGLSTTTEGVRLNKPAVSTRGRLSFVDTRTKEVMDYIFEFTALDGVGEFSVSMTLNYYEIVNIDTVIKSISIPITSKLNPSLKRTDHVAVFDGQLFFDAFTSSIPASNNPPKRVFLDKEIDIIIEAADADYTLYRDINGPIDGLAQTRPEFTNITNGLGIFASRNRKFYQVSLSSDTRNLIFARYGSRNNLAQYRGFDPQ